MNPLNSLLEAASLVVDSVNTGFSPVALNGEESLHPNTTEAIAVTNSVLTIVFTPF
jgi:hypothetical protein